MTSRDLLLRLLTRVVVDPTTGCWNWTGAFSQSGWRGVFYAAGWVHGRVWRLNRLMLMLYTAPTDYPRWPEETFVQYLERLCLMYRGREAAHTCDNSKCICPLHLEWKGHRANVQEQVARRKLTRQAQREAAGA